MNAQQRAVEAGAMAMAVRFDPQFTVPSRPRFPRELVVVPFAEGLLVDGTDGLQVLRGRATQTLLPRLMPLLDGTRTLADLAATLPDVPAAHLEQAIALLYTRGLLEDGIDDPATAVAFDEQTLGFFRRYVDATRVNRSAWSAARRLQDATVDVFALAAAETRTLVVEQLRAAGIGSVTARELGVPVTEARAAGSRLAVVLVDGRDDRQALEDLDRDCSRRGIPWLRVAIDSAARTADLGPYFDRGETACYACFHRVNEAVSAPAVGPATARDASLDTRQWVAMLVLEAVALLSRVMPAATALDVRRYDLTTWTSQTLHYPRLPGCVHCHPLDGVDAGPVPTALLYESAVRFPSRHLLDPKQHQAHYRTSNVELALEGKRYPSLDKLTLPDPAQLACLSGATLEHVARPVAHPTADLGAAQLAALLLFGAGIRSDSAATAVKRVKPKRWSATGGNLGSVELYVAVYDVDGVDPGLYFYQPYEHVLARLEPRRPRADVGAFVARAIDGEGGRAAGAAIVSTAALHRVAQKYGAFAYRIANLDAGVALAQMQTVGNSLGLQARIAGHCDDELIAEHFGLTGLSEPVTGALLVYGRREWRLQ